MDTDILCQGNFKILISDKVKGNFIAVSDSQQAPEAIEYLEAKYGKDWEMPKNNGM